MKKLWKPTLILAAVAIMAFGTLGSGAWFSDSAASPESALSSGTLKINEALLTTATLGTLDNMAPGDKTENVVIAIQNDGTLPLFWVGKLVVTGDVFMQEAIYIDNAKMEFVGGAWDEPTDQFLTDGIGSGLYPDAYNVDVAKNAFGKMGLNVFGLNNYMGVTPNQFMGVLKPGYAYRLTLNFGFAEAAGNAYQDREPVNISFEVNAMQPKAGAIKAYDATIDTGWLLDTWIPGQLANQHD